MSISNYSALYVFLSLSDSQAAALNYGIMLAPYATYYDSNNGDYQCWQGKVTAIEATGAAVLAVWERVAY